MMRKILFLVAVTAFVGMTNAQQKNASKSNQVEKVQHKNNFEQWGEELELTADQKAKIQAIYEASSKEVEALRTTGTSADFMKINQQKEEKIKALLTTEQLGKLEEIEKRKNQEKLGN